MKNKNAQAMQKLSKAAQEKKAGGKEAYRKEMTRRVKVRWDKEKEAKKLSPVKVLA